MKAALLIAAACLGLAACSDKPQTAQGMQVNDAPPHAGASQAFTDAGWKAGDKTAWEQQLKTRAQAGQNEYNRVK